MRRFWKRVRQIWVAAGLAATLVFTVWSLLAYRASGEAKAAVRSDAAVEVSHERGAWRFLPLRKPAAPVGLIFFAGSLVDPVAYAPLLRAVAEEGFPAWLVELPRRGAFGGAEDPELSSRVHAILRAPGVPRRWLVGGHSRGAVVAVNVAAHQIVEDFDGMAGLVLVGTSHPRDVDLSALEVPVTKIAGTRDGLASPEEVEQNRPKLPASTRWVWIEGGNHCQFGWYGFQPGDRTATIPAAAQRKATIRAVLEALHSAGPSNPPDPSETAGLLPLH